ncbi:toxin-antitoxin system YwqK family antitoxin [Christiangramia sabulilitoris]|uniref:Nicotinic acid mononucleotide adenyltransferase n=1 Tax=Christiangramia sabulilitoris TaxID=2583991 RepID=A0A550I8N3_9FLAO|nr:nicotinic acid mononucleotide adenyltransferase [Christiangramia sabulilitoris]TRO67198.1 nicotinic acid mononucleotide adenyltransferase [Christiangramia sabulilitoris]
MKRFKNIFFAAIFVAGGTMMAQENAPKPVFEQQDGLIKGTFYYEDGSIRQEGTYKDGRLHGEWISYDQNGEKTAIANYRNGKKEGKWFFWSEDKLTEVDYQNSVIANVNTWNSNSALVNE